MNYILKKSQFSGFYKQIADSYRLIAPVQGKETSYEEITDEEMLLRVYWDSLPLHPAKHIFHERNQPVLNYNRNKVTAPKNSAKTVLFGLRRCDLNSILHHDMAFISSDFTDPYYKAKREKAILIGLHCKKENDEYCFCNSMELVDAHDIMLYDRGEYFLIETATTTGKAFAKTIQVFQQTKETVLPEDRRTEGADHLSREKKAGIADFFDRTEWERASKLCLSCAACNIICPSCYCFEFHDESELKNLYKGQRMKNQSSCQLQCFTRVAGDYVFRKEKLQRFKHRIYHQLQYFRERYGKNLCTGCGRCIRGCPKRIDWVDVLNKM